MIRARLTTTRTTHPPQMGRSRKLRRTSSRVVQYSNIRGGEMKGPRVLRGKTRRSEDGAGANRF